jgi:hypothetical protein
MSLLDRLKDSHSAGRRFVETHRPAIREALEAGFSARAIYRALQAEGHPPPIGERQFQRHLARRFATPGDAGGPGDGAKKRSAAAAASAVSAPRSGAPKRLRRFEWDPTGDGEDIT